MHKSPAIRVAALAALLVSTAAAGASSLFPYSSMTLSRHMFDEGYGAATVDSSANGHWGFIRGSGPAWVAGLDAGGIDFRNPGSVILDPPVPLVSEWTIQGWARFPLDNYEATWNYFVCGPDDNHSPVVL